jgi:hypothetical protein
VKRIWLLAANSKSSVIEEPAPIGENKLIVVSDGDCLPPIYPDFVSVRADILCLLSLSKKLCVTF